MITTITITITITMSRSVPFVPFYRVTLHYIRLHYISSHCIQLLCLNHRNIRWESHNAPCCCSESWSMEKEMMITTITITITMSRSVPTKWVCSLPGLEHHLHLEEANGPFRVQWRRSLQVGNFSSSAKIFGLSEEISNYYFLPISFFPSASHLLDHLARLARYSVKLW